MIGSFTRKSAWNGLMKKLRAKAVQNSGFTLIEVIFSIIVLSIVSITLLEMFTVSTKTNAAAGVLDKARSLCVEASEEFRANPVGPNPMDPSDTGDSAYLMGFRPSTGAYGETIYTKYFNRHWEAEPTESQAEYVLEIVASKTDAETISVSYYPASAVRMPDTGMPGAVKVDHGVTIRLVSEDGDDDDSGPRYKLLVGPNSYEIIQEDKIIYGDKSVAAVKTAMIPIHLDCSGIGADTMISVINEIGSLTRDGAEYVAIADIYLCDVDEGLDVTVYAVEGVVTSNSVSTKMQKITRYSADISVREKDSGHIIARTRAETTLVSN